MSTGPWNDIYTRLNQSQCTGAKRWRRFGKRRGLVPYPKTQAKPRLKERETTLQELNQILGAGRIRRATTAGHEPDRGPLSGVASTQTRTGKAQTRPPRISSQGVGGATADCAKRRAAQNRDPK